MIIYEPPESGISIPTGLTSMPLGVIRWYSIWYPGIPPVAAIEILPFKES